jgi:hypothetical protein
VYRAAVVHSALFVDICKFSVRSCDSSFSYSTAANALKVSCVNRPVFTYAHGASYTEMAGVSCMYYILNELLTLCTCCTL